MACMADRAVGQLRLAAQHQFANNTLPVEHIIVFGAKFCESKK
jgi:hypothetical protein